MTEAGKHVELRLGKGSAFVKTQLKRLPQEEETWEADFRKLPNSQSATHYVGVVVTQPHGFLLAHKDIESKPTVNDLATLLAHAMRRPLTESAHRPSRLLLRGHRKWQELIPHLEDIGIEVAVQNELPQLDEAYEDYFRHSTAEQAAVEMLFPAIAKWVRSATESSDQISTLVQGVRLAGRPR